MRRMALLLAILAIPVWAGAEQPVAEALRVELKIQKELLAQEVEALRREREAMQQAWARVVRDTVGMIQANNQGESLDGLVLRDEDLRVAEAEVLGRLNAAQMLRKSILSRKAEIEATEREIATLEQTVGPDVDPITGTWRLVYEPGGLEGFAYLRLDGTLVQGTYRLAGDWTGSLRGTYVGRRIQLERIDSQVGFASRMFGRLVRGGMEARIEGTWEASELASGQPSSGSWVADRVREAPE